MGSKVVFMKILLTGRDGQVGFALHKKLISLGKVFATNRQTLNLTNFNEIKAFVEIIKPDIIINAAAYTKVDQAESESVLAYQINAEAPKALAEKALELDIPIIHFSTDYVFDGLKNNPYLETDLTNPQSVYGKTKWEGEEVIRQYKKHIILRTSWVFGGHGQNFLKTILKLSQEKTFLNIVSDQIGSPTSADTLANVTCKIIKTMFSNPNFKDFGTYHITLEGETDWYHYTCLIVEEAARLGLKTNMTPKAIHAILSHEYPALAKRPMNSRLNMEKIKKTFMLELPHWKDEVKKIIQTLTH